MQVNGLFTKPHTIQSLPFAAIHVYENGRRVELTQKKPDKIILHHSDGVFGQLGVTISTHEPGALKAYKEGRITGAGIFNAFEKFFVKGSVTLKSIIKASLRNHKKKAVIRRRCA